VVVVVVVVVSKSKYVAIHDGIVRSNVGKDYIPFRLLASKGDILLFFHHIATSYLPIGSRLSTYKGMILPCYSNSPAFLMKTKEGALRPFILYWVVKRVPVLPCLCRGIQRLILVLKG